MPRKPNLATVAAKEDRLATLKSLLNGLTAAFDSASEPRDKASLSRQIIDVLAQIDEIESKRPDKNKETPLYVIKNKHAERVPRTANSRRASSG